MDIFGSTIGDINRGFNSGNRDEKRKAFIIIFVCLLALAVAGFLYYKDPASWYPKIIFSTVLGYVVR